MWADIKQRVSQYIERQGLLTAKEQCLVALSGGADSVCLLLLLKDLGYAVEAAHCNFRLRGKESLRDEQFCKELCQSHNIPLHIAHFDTKEFASLHKISIEMAARDLRYNYFRQLLKDLGIGKVAVAHHKDDLAETVLLNLLRNSGIRGLRGIAPQRGDIIRPLLTITRAEIEAALRQKRQTFVVDSTNLEDDVKRNKVRLHVIPLLRTINPAAVDSIAQSASLLGEALKVYDEAIRRSVEQVTVNQQETADNPHKTADGAFAKRTVISVPLLMRQPSPESTLFEALRRFGFSPTVAQDVFASLSCPKAGKVFSSESFDILVDRDQLIVERRLTDELPTVNIPMEGTYAFGSHRLRVSIQEIKPDFKPSRERNSATLDAQAIEFPLCIRRIKEGDRFMPFGMRGCRLVSDYLTDKKRDLFIKRRQLLVLDNRNKPLWLVGERTDDRCKITSETKKVLLLTIINEE